MKRNVFMFLGLSVVALSAPGCCACRHGGCATPAYDRGYVQPPIGGQFQQPRFQQSIPNGSYQQPGSSLPTLQQTQQGLGQFGRNLGSRISNGVINRGVNHLINGAVSAF